MPTAPADFRSLIEQHQSMVYSIALRVSGEPAAAEEIAQDVFLELFRSGGRLDGPDHTRFWLRRVTVHRATDVLRKNSRRAEHAADEWDDTLHAASSGDNTAALHPGLSARLDDLLRALPENLRVPVVLRYQEDMLPEEIAALLGQPIATVKSHLQRALKLLRRKAEITLKEYVR